LAVAGCQQAGPPPSVESGTWTAPPPEQQVITVAHGDSIYLIARRYAVPMRALIDLNHLTPPYRLETGQRLVLPDIRTYTVVPGDRLSVLAQRFHVDTTELARLNQIAPPYIIRVGQLLVLPGGAVGPTAAAPMPGRKPEAAEPNPVHGTPPTIRTAALPPPGAAAGPAASTSAPPPAPPPRRPPPAAGTTPTATPPTPAATARPPGPVPHRPPPPAETPAAETPAEETPVAEPAAAAASRTAEAAPPAAPAAHGGARFLWPVQGKILSGFGDKPDGRHNDGINIEAERGTAVVAADGGVVAYSGNELRGYGNLLLIRHGDGTMTAYAHLDRALVERGATVRRGEKIGIVGATGGVTEPQLHFEVRRGSQAVDPIEFLEPPSRGAAG
jgi:murein DD-endopeptidase MepM/ murein hydrolase activator NlpD